MYKIADIFRHYAPAYLQKFGDAIPSEHRKVIHAIVNCRTPNSGVAVFGCKYCCDKKFVFLGCGNRHCPNCQQDKSQQWLSRAMNNVLPGPHFMISFTVPAELRRFFRSNRKATYNALFRASSDALKDAIANPKYCGADLPGFFGVLHTWTRQLEYHPHIHYVVPGGGLDHDTGLWKNSQADYCVPQRVLSSLVKAKFRDLMMQAGLLNQIPKHVWRRTWVVDAQAVGNNTEGVLRYLAPYVFRVAISDSRIVSVHNDLVTFKYTPSGTKDTKLLTLHASEFIRRFLQHVLPTGFMKIRYYGFMSPGCPVSNTQVAAMVQLANSQSPVFTPPQVPPSISQRPSFKCPSCGKEMQLQQIWKNNRQVYTSTNPPRLHYNMQ